MDRVELDTLWSKTLRLTEDKPADLEKLAESVFEVYRHGDRQFGQHVSNRLKQIGKVRGMKLPEESFDMETAKLLVADEIGFSDWDSLIAWTERRHKKPLIFQYAVAAMVRGDFSALESTVGGPDSFHDVIVDWFEKGYFEDEQKTLAEIFSAACMLGHERTAEYLLDKGVDPLAGMQTGLNGFHYAASSGRLSVIKLLIARDVPMEEKNMYGGTVFEQAMWSAVNEYAPDHAAIVEALVEAGGIVDEGYREWWEKQNVPDAATKERIAEILKRHKEFHQKISAAEQAVAEAEQSSNKRAFADALKHLGNILRRPPFTRDAANVVYERAANLYRELGLPLEEAWVKRHIGINHEYAERLTEAEQFYGEALELYRAHSVDDLDYANAVRYPAVIKNRLGKRDESAILWEEACDRYSKVHPNGIGEGVAEAAAWLTIFAIEKGDLSLAKKWFAKASEASEKSGDPDTHKFIAEVRSRLEESENA